MSPQPEGIFVLFYLCVFLYATCVQWLQMVLGYPVCILGMKLGVLERVVCFLKL